MTRGKKEKKRKRPLIHYIALPCWLSSYNKVNPRTNAQLLTEHRKQDRTRLRLKKKTGRENMDILY